MSSNVTLSVEQLEELIAKAVSTALAAKQTKSAAKPVDPAKQERAEAYLSGKKAVALRLAKEKGVHYSVYKKGRKLLVWSEHTEANAIRQNRRGDLGTKVWSTYEGGFRLYMAK